MESADRVGFIVHKGKQVLVLDFTNCAPEEVKSVSDEARLIIAAQPQNSVLALADFTGALEVMRDAILALRRAGSTRTSLP